jgi:8-oxo-dGTP diphosphatase
MPSAPLPVVGVGAVVLHERRVLLVKRARPPLAGRWLVPGGRVEAGETLAAAVVREVREETGLDVLPRAVVLVLDRIERTGAVLDYHYVIVDFACDWVGGMLAAGSDAADVAWAPLSELDAFDVPVEARRLIDTVAAGTAARLPLSPAPFTIDR